MKSNKSGLLIDLYELMMAQVYFRYKPEYRGTFELSIRSKSRPFYVAYGIKESLRTIRDLRFSKEDVDYLRTLDLFCPDFLKYLKNFSFRGDVWAVEEPEILFAEEPIVRVTGTLMEAQIFESILLNIINLHTTLTTKALRIVLSAAGRSVYDFSLRRAQGEDAGIAASACSYVAGCAGTANVLAGMKYGIPVAGTMAHSFIQSFPDEIASFRAFVEMFPDKAILLIDTYNTAKGLEHAITVAKELQKSRHSLKGVRIDSGDLVQEARAARAELDMNGFVDTQVIVSGNLDEYAIQELTLAHAPVDGFGVGTHMGTSSDMPYCDVIYKLVEMETPWGAVKPIMKLSPGKVTMPHRKQVYRKVQKGMVYEDIICREGEKCGGKPLLQQVITAGELMTDVSDNLQQDRAALAGKVAQLPRFFKDMSTFRTTTSLSGVSHTEYPVHVSPVLQKTTEKAVQALSASIGRRRILFVDVDTQHDFVDPKGLLYVDGAQKCKRVWKKLFDAAAKHGITVLSSLDTHSRNDPEFKQFPAHCVAGTPGAEKVEGTVLNGHATIGYRKPCSPAEITVLAEGTGQIVVEKNTFDMFSNPNVEAVLQALRPHEVYVWGVALEYCVKSATLGLIKRFSEVSVVEDAVRAKDPSAAQMVYQELESKGVRKISSAALLERLAQRQQAGGTAE
jgi:nicotinate phosphoribosyltransferase